MRILQGYTHVRMLRKMHALKLLHNVYGQKQAGRVWNQYLDEGIIKAGFTPRKWDPCLYYHASVIVLIYIDNCIIMSANDTAIDNVLRDLREQGFSIDDQGDVSDFLGIKITRCPDGAIKLAQPQLIDSIIVDLHLQHNTRTCNTPTLSTSILHEDHDAPDMKPEFNDQSIIGKLNFLEKSTCINLSYSIHQCVCFAEAPKVSHAKAVRCIGKYLLSTCDKGLIMHLNHACGFKCWVDSDLTSKTPGCTDRSNDSKIQSCMGYLLYRMPHLMGIKITDHHGAINN